MTQVFLDKLAEIEVQILFHDNTESAEKIFSLVRLLLEHKYKAQEVLVDRELSDCDTILRVREEEELEYMEILK